MGENERPDQEPKEKIKKSETFSNIAAGVQSLMLSIAVVIGGWWTLQTFGFQNPSFSGESFMVAGSSNEESLSGNIMISALNKKKRIYTAKVEITNSDRKTLQSIPLGNCPLYFSRLEKTTSSTFKVKERYKTYAVTAAMKENIDDQGIDEKGNLLRLSIPNTQTRKVTFLFTAPKAGSYLLEINPCERFRKSCFIQEYLYIK